MSSEVAIEVEAVSRVFGRGESRVSALHEVSFSVERGTVVALLGVNGAGKTTLTKILSTLLLPTSGTARICGHDVIARTSAVRRLSSVVFGGDRGLYLRLSGAENMRFFGMLAGVSRADLRRRMPEALERSGLAEVSHRRVETYSKGMRQRLHLAIGLISEPAVLLLDEPTVGLDPIEAERLRDAIVAMRKSGTTILLTSHYLLDVERLADRVVMLSSGRVVRDIPLADFAAEAGYAAVVVVRVRGHAPDLRGLLPPGATAITEPAASGEQAEITIRLMEWGSTTFLALGALFDKAEVTDVKVRPAGLEEAFTRLSAGSAR